MDENNTTQNSVCFEGYDQTEKIGEGGMASVWKARQISLDRWVAIKVLSPEQCSDDEEIDRFQSEARAVAKMNHSGIVQVYDAFYRNDRFCFVMEFVDGYTVGSWLQNRGYLAQEECLFVAAGVAEALSYAWNRQKLIHCDIKPENIMIDVAGSVKVTDFGLSKSLSSLQARKSLPDGGYVFGTPAYISPEQATADRQVTIHADMYALGASLYHMSTGTRLFAESSAEEVMEMQVNAQYKDPYELNTKLSPFFCDFLERLLCKNRNDRYSRWEEVMEEIENLKKGLPLSYGEIDPVKAVSTIKRSSLRDTARNALLKKLNIRQRQIKPTADPAASPDHKSKCGVELFGQGDSPRSTNAATSPYRVFVKKFTASTQVIAKNHYFRIGLKCLAGFVIIATIWGVVSDVDHKKKCRIASAAKIKLSEIDDYLRINPTAYRVAILQCNELISHLEGASYATLKQDVINKRQSLEVAQKNHIERIIKDLREEISPLVEQRQFIRAVSVVSSYNGDLAEETQHERTRMADTLKKQASFSSRARSSNGND